MNSPSNKTAPTGGGRREPPLAWVGSITILVGLLALAFGLVLLSNDYFVVGWVLIAVGGALVLIGAALLVRYLRPGKTTI